MLRLERPEPAYNRLRFYNIAIMPTLLGGWALVRETWFETESAAIEVGGCLEQRQKRREYRATRY